MSTNTRDHDIVLLGASGFVGRYSALHLANSAPPRRPHRDRRSIDETPQRGHARTRSRLVAHTAAGGAPIVAATLTVRSLRGGISGGTIDSLRQQMREAKTDAAARRLLADPYALTPGPSVRLPGHGGSGWGEVRDTWQAPFIMGAYNQQIA